MTRLSLLLAATIPLSLLAAPAYANDDKAKAVCAEAEERYQEAFGHPSANAEGARVVLMYKYRFCPENIVVKPGTTVRWVNVDKRTSHSVLLKDSDEPESDRVFSEESVEFTFYIPGPQDYLCGPHWERRDMFGRVTVEP